MPAMPAALASCDTSADLERQCLQRVSRQDRGRLVKGAVHGGPPAAQVVVIHGRQIVMHQGIAMDAFERRAHPE